MVKKKKKGLKRQQIIAMILVAAVKPVTYAHSTFYLRQVNCASTVLKMFPFSGTALFGPVCLSSTDYRSHHIFSVFILFYFIHYKGHNLICD